MGRFVLLMLSVISMASMSYQQSRQEQIDQNSVYVQFDKNEGELLELKDWGGDETATFQMVTAEAATTYCADNKLEECALANETTFAVSDVVTSEPEAFNGDVRLLVYIDLDGMDTDPADTSVLPKQALKSFLRLSRMDYNSELSSSEYNITLMFVDSERVAPAIDNTINYIMIVVSILILLSACLLALVLKCKENMEQKQKLNQYEDNRGSTPRSPNDATEHVTLTTIKPSDDDGKEASEGTGSIHSWKNKIGPHTAAKDNVKTQETQTVGKVIFVSDETAGVTSDPRGSIQTPRETGVIGISHEGWEAENEKKDEQPTDTTQGRGSSSFERDGGNHGQTLADRFMKGNDTNDVESSNPSKAGGTTINPQRASRHNILPPLGEHVVMDKVGEVKGSHQRVSEGSESDGQGGDKKQRRRKRKQKRRKTASSDDEKNDLLEESFRQKPLSPLGE